MSDNDFIRAGMDELDEAGGGFPDSDFTGQGQDMEDFGLDEFSDAESPDGEDSGVVDFGQAGGTDDFDGPDVNVQGEPKEKGSVIRGAKYGLILLGVFLVIVVVAMGVVNWLRGRETEPKVPDPTPEVTQSQGGAQESITTQPATPDTTQVVDLSPETPAVRPQGDTLSEGWIWVEKSPDLEFSKPIDGVFTVTNIKYVSKIVEAKRTIQLKCVLTGSIDGVYGTYEADVPYDKALNLEVGTKLYVSYCIAEKDGVQYIGGVSF